MNKASTTKFDFESAFKALDDINAPAVSGGIHANKPALTEIFSSKTGFDALFEEYSNPRRSLKEEYYDVNDTNDLTDAKDSREAEVAMAKLARIEKIVDLDAESPDDLLASYVGKLIIQCPQCMTLFYKNPEDIEKSEEDPDTCNVNEVCQHCGNESGYTLIGKVGEASEEEVNAVATYAAEEEPADTEEPAAEPEADEATDEPATETEDTELADIDLDEIDFDIEDDETDASESFSRTTAITEAFADGTTKNLNESEDLDISDAEFETLITSAEFKKPISTAEVRSMLNDDESADTKKKDLTNEQVNSTLVEGPFMDKLKAKINQFVSNADAHYKTRDQKADFVLKNASKEGSVVPVDKDGNPVLTDDVRRFEVFVVLCFQDHYTNGRQITIAPPFNSKELLLAKRPDEKDNFKQAEAIAKGWSMKQGNGPAYVYLAKKVDDPAAAFLCEYYKGELVNNDMLDKYYKATKDDLKASKLMSDGEVTQDDPNAPNDTDTEATSTEESFSNIVMSLDTLTESNFENCVSEFLVENSFDVASFRLTECSATNKALTLTGKVYKTSGDILNTTFILNEAMMTQNNAITFRGCDKAGTSVECSGQLANNATTFITESFKYN